MINLLKSPVCAVASAILLFLAANFFLTAYDEFASYEGRLRGSRQELEALKEHHKEQERKRRILTRVKGFVDRARSLGVERHNWDYYDVNIDEPVSFPEARQILAQTVNTSSYYFRPIKLYIQKNLESETGKKKKMPRPSSADSKETKEGDIYLTLKGTFVVPQR